jgi:hypothetical protein
MKKQPEIKMRYSGAVVWAINLIALGASVYTFINALPKLDKLKEDTTDLVIKDEKLSGRLEVIESVYSLKIDNLEEKLDDKFDNLEQLISSSNKK